MGPGSVEHSERAELLRNAANLYDLGVVALRVAGLWVHPECQTPEEMTFAKEFHSSPPKQACERCERGW